MALNSETLLARADRLARRGQRDEARAAYLEVLKLTPDHFGALNNLGALLHDMNYRSAARTAYARAVACHPQNPVGHVNLANALRGDDDLAAARAHAETALPLCQGPPGAPQALEGLLFALGAFAAAAPCEAMVSPFAPASACTICSTEGGRLPKRVSTGRTYRP